MGNAKVIRHKVYTGSNKVVAMELDDGRVGVVCATMKHAWLSKDWESAQIQAHDHINNVCELRHLLPA